MGYRRGRWRRKLVRLAGTLCLLGLAIGGAAALAAGGDLDQGFSGDGRETTSFGNNDRTDEALGVAIQPDGRIVAAGFTDQGAGSQTGSPEYHPDWRFALARYMPDGSLDQSFSGDGKRKLGFANRADLPGGPVGDDIAADVAIQPDGKIVAAGQSYQRGSGYSFAVARFKANGNLDRGFSGDGMRTFDFATDARGDYGHSVAIQADGKIVVAGSSYGYSFAVARLNRDGSLDRSFSGDGRQTSQFGGFLPVFGLDVAIQPDGRIVVAGGYRFTLARYRADGRLDHSFSGDGKRRLSFGGEQAVAQGVAIQPDGRIVAAGYSKQGGSALTSDFDFAVARLEPDGGFDQGFSGDGKQLTSFGPSLDGALDVAIQPDGRIVAAGFSDQAAGTGDYDLALARYMPDGDLDQSFSGDGRQTTLFAGSPDDVAFGVAIQPDGKIVAAGHSYQGVFTGYDFALARYLGP